MTTKMNKWIGFQFSTGSETGKDFLAFQKDAKTDLKKMLTEAGMKLKSFSGGHYEFSAVAENEENGRYVYVSISDVRYFKDKWISQVLVRAMKHEKDWSGGFNQYTTWDQIGKKVKTISLSKDPAYR